MANGRLGSAALATATDTTVYTCPSATLAILNVNLTNRSPTTPVYVRLAIMAGSSVVESEYIEFNTLLVPNGVLERTGLALSAGQKIMAYASTASVSCNVWGLEESV